MNSYWNPLAERRDVVPGANKCVDRNCLDGIAHDMAVQPAYVVIHTEVGTEASAQGRFENAADSAHASAHYSVNLDGSIVQFVDEKDAAYHAGDFSVNMDSIGIEHEDNGDYNGPRTPELYAASARLVADICGRYGIPIDRAHIRRHNEVSDNPTGCPDGLDIDHIVAVASGRDGTPPPFPPEIHLGPFPKPVTGVVTGLGDAFDWTTGAAAGAIAPGTPVTYTEAKRVMGTWYVHIDGGSWALKDEEFDTYNAHDPANTPQAVWDAQHATVPATAPAAPEAAQQPPDPAPAPVAPPAPAPEPPAPAPAPPEPAPVEVTVPPIPDPGLPPEPSALVERGVTTSEWRALVLYAKQAAVTGTVAVVSYVGLKVGVHFNIPSEALNAIIDLELGGALAVASYAVSRGLRKLGVTQ